MGKKRKKIWKKVFNTVFSGNTFLGNIISGLIVTLLFNAASKRLCERGMEAQKN
jgi:hypothetical protein